VGIPQLLSQYDKVSRKKRLISIIDFVDKCEEEIILKMIVGS
jgi:hypothetical protein